MIIASSRLRVRCGHLRFGVNYDAFKAPRKEEIDNKTKQKFPIKILSLCVCLRSYLERHIDWINYNLILIFSIYKFP